MRLFHLLLAAFVIAACGSEAPNETRAADTSPLPVAEPASVALKRLTRAQYTQSVLDVLGKDIAVPIALEPDTEIDGFFALGASQSSISALGVERYESAAYAIAEQVMSPGELRSALMPCVPSTTVDGKCAQVFVRTIGRKLFRRPLTKGEVERYASVGNAAASKLGDFYEGLGFSLAGLLQSPHFLFRVELGASGPASRLAYSDDEMASRLSFFLWNTTPDDELLDAADRGELSTDEGLRLQVDRLLGSNRAREGVRNFFLERFGLHRLDDLVKDSTVFTSMSAELGPDAREETLRTVEDLVFDRQADYRDLFTSGRSFINRRLAALYGVPAPSLEGFAATEFPSSSPRTGLLGHASVLALYAHSVSTSSTLRGIFVRTRLLCHEIPPPPADVDTSLPEPSIVMPTLRDRIADHLNVEVCASCHQFLDPIGLGLEQFDAIGKYRLTENDVVIDPSGSVDKEIFSDARGLGTVLARNPSAASCLVIHVYRYATGHRETKGEDGLLKALIARFEQDGFRIKPLLKHIVLSEGFRFGSEASPLPADKEGE
jgi:hypothetical protein